MAGKARLLLADRDAGQGGSVGPLPQEDSDIISAWAAQPGGHRHDSTAPQRKEACGGKNPTLRRSSTSLASSFRDQQVTREETRFPILSQGGDGEEIKVAPLLEG